MYYVVFVTVANKEEGEKIARVLLEKKYAACVNIVPGVESYYWWEGKIETDSESLLIIKTMDSCVDKLIDEVKANHSYSVPEVIAMPIEKGNKSYLDWIKQSLGQQC